MKAEAKEMHGTISTPDSNSYTKFARQQCKSYRRNMSRQIFLHIWINLIDTGSLGLEFKAEQEGYRYNRITHIKVLIVDSDDCI